MKKLLLTASIFSFVTVLPAMAQEQGLFQDLPESSWEYQTLKQLHEKKVLVGLKEEQFKTDKSITAYEAATAIAQTLEKMTKLIADGSKVEKGDVIAMLEMKDSFKKEMKAIDDRLWDLQDSVDLTSAEMEGLKERVHVLENKAEWFQPNGEMDFRMESINATERFYQFDGSDFAGLPAGAPVTLKTLRKRDVSNDDNMKFRSRLKFTSEIDDDVTLTGQFTMESNFGRVNESRTDTARFPGSEGSSAVDVGMDQANIRWDINDKLAVVVGRTQTTIGKGLVVDTTAPRSWLTGISVTADYFGDYNFWVSFDKVAENTDYDPLTKKLLNDPVENDDINAWLLYIKGPFFSDKNEVGLSYVHAPSLPYYVTVPGATAAAVDRLSGLAEQNRGQAAGLAATQPDAAALLRGQAEAFETKAGQLRNLLANRQLMSYYPDVPGGLAFAEDEYKILGFWIEKEIGRFKNINLEWAKNLAADVGGSKAYQLGIDWGKNFKKDDWSVHAKIRRAEGSSIVPSLASSYLDSYGYGANRRLIELSYKYRVTPRMDLGLGMKWVRSLTPSIVNTDPFTVTDGMKHFSIYSYMNTYF